ncbi:MAG: hypothetical protein ABJQ42_13325 [Erythrobacter sp.]
MMQARLHLQFGIRYSHQMRINLTKGMTEDSISIAREDGTRAEFKFPHKGPMSHDAIHFFVERQVKMECGFWGMVAAGIEPKEVAALAAKGGHASSNRASEPSAQITQLLQAERLVECFEAEFWSGLSDDDAVIEMAEAGWRASQVAPIENVRAKLAAIRNAIRTFAVRWAETEVGDSVTLNWDLFEEDGNV